MIKDLYKIFLNVLGIRSFQDPDPIDSLFNSDILSSDLETFSQLGVSSEEALLAFSDFSDLIEKDKDAYPLISNLRVNPEWVYLLPRRYWERTRIRSPT